MVGNEDRLPDGILDRFLIDLEDEPSCRPLLFVLDACLTSIRLKLGDGRIEIDLAADLLRNQLGKLRPTERCAHVQITTLVGDGRLANRSIGHLGKHLLDENHDVAVVGKGLICLQHGELGVVQRVDALIPEDATDLENTLHTTHDQAF